MDMKQIKLTICLKHRRKITAILTKESQIDDFLLALNEPIVHFGEIIFPQSEFLFANYKTL